MRTTIKATHTELTAMVRERIERMCAQLEKLANLPDPDALRCDIEVGKTTEHHRKGVVYRAEILFAAGGKHFRAVAEGETGIAALDIAHDEVRDALVHSKHKKQSLLRALGVRCKAWGHSLAWEAAHHA